MSALAKMSPPATPPIYLEAEQAVLGALMFNNDLYWQLGDFLEARHFYEPVHQRIFGAIGELVVAGRKASIITVAAALADDKALIELNGQAYLKVMVAASIAAPDARDYARLICSLAQRRDLLAVGQEIVAMATAGQSAGDDTRLVEEAEGLLHKLRADPTQAGSGFSTVSEAAARALENAARAYREPTAAQVHTGIAAVDDLIGGLYPKDLIVVGGATSMGKTSLCQAFALNAARAGRKVVCFSLEMSDEEWSARYVAQIAGVPADVIESGRFNEEHFRKINEAKLALDGLPMHLDDDGELRVSQIRARAARVQRISGLDLIVVDHLRFLAPDNPRADPIERIQQLTRDLKRTAKALGVPVVLAAHLNREHQKRPDHRPIVSDLYGSSAIEQDADVILFVHREEWYLQRAPAPDDQAMEEWAAKVDRWAGKAEIICAKRRRGAVGSRIIGFDGPLTLFHDLKPEDNPQEAFL